MSPGDLFLESRVCARHRVYGYKLRPLCLLDLVALEAAGSPVFASGEIRPADLVLAARMLSRPHRSDLCIDADCLAPHRLTIARACLLSFNRALQSFRAYVADHLTSVEMWRDAGGSDKPFGAHWAQALATYVSRETHMTQREIWAGPIGHVLWMAAACEEQTSTSRVRTEADQAAIDSAHESAAQIEGLKQVEIEHLRSELLTASSESERGRITARLAKLTGT